MTETLWGVIIGGLITLVVSLSTQLMTIKQEKKTRQREELRPLASRTLRTAQQAWQALVMQRIWEDRSEKSSSHEMAVEKMAEAIQEWQEAYSELQLALEELSLLLPNVEQENNQLSNALLLGRFKPGPRASISDEQAEYSAARKALQHKLRLVLNTD